MSDLSKLSKPYFGENSKKYIYAPLEYHLKIKSLLVLVVLGVGVTQLGTKRNTKNPDFFAFFAPSYTGPCRGNLRSPEIQTL